MINMGQMLNRATLLVLGIRFNVKKKTGFFPTLKHNERLKHDERHKQRDVNVYVRCVYVLVLSCLESTKLGLFHKSQY